MHCDWSAEQLALRESVLHFGRQALAEDVGPRDATSAFSRELWNRCAEFGVMGLPFDQADGGTGLDLMSTVLAFEALGQVCPDNGLLFSIAAQMWSVQMPIARFGTPAQRERYLRGLCSGELIGAHGMSEPDSGSDAFALRTRAERNGDDYVLTGTKTFVSDAPVADVFLVFATTDPARGALGLTAFLVDRKQDGVHVGRSIKKMGLRTSPMSELVLDGCVVPVANRLGREGRGVTMFADAMEYERGCILASAVGAMQRLLDGSIVYARERKQFGKSISQFQVIAHRLVDMQVRLDHARLVLYKSAWAKQTGKDAAYATAMAKLVISEAWTATARDAMQIRGGYGYTEEYQMEREVRDSMGSLFFSGTSDIQRELIARTLGL